jgi:predicted ferric reductase
MKFKYFSMLTKKTTSFCYRSSFCKRLSSTRVYFFGLWRAFVVPKKVSNSVGEKIQRPAMGFFLIVVVLIAGALGLPFVYESQTLWYKIGLQKTMLRGGQIMGLLALVCLMIQIFLGTRDLLVETLGAALRMAWHRANGIVLSCLAALHIILVLVPEGITNLPIGIKQWPEMVGAVLFMVIIFQVISTFFREQLGVVYKQWRIVHRALGYTAICLAAVHVLFVADSFAQGVPRIVLLALLISMFVVLSTANILRYFGKE